MGKILKNVRLFTGGVDVTGESNKLEFSGEVEEVDVTTFGDYDATTDRIWQVLLGGEFKGKISGAGVIDTAGGIDAETHTRLGSKTAFVVGPDGAAVGALALVTDVLTTSRTGFGERMKALPWSAGWSTNRAIARGVFAHPPGTARTATGNGTAVQHIAVPATGELVAAINVLSIAGTATPTITVKIQSSPDNTFAAPVDRITFDPATTVDGQVKRVAGAITDTWYRAQWTISGTTPSFLFVAALGVVADP